jgi:hypothetical protein
VRAKQFISDYSVCEKKILATTQYILAIIFSDHSVIANKTKMENINLTLYTNGFFASVPKSVGIAQFIYFGQEYLTLGHLEGGSSMKFSISYILMTFIP